jgi:hypothetical protein
MANRLISSGQGCEEAVDLLNRQIAIAREIGNDVAAWIGAGTLGEAYSKLGRIDDTLRSMRECVDSARTLGDIRMLGESLCEIGVVHLNQRLFVEARTCLEEGLMFVAEAGYRFRQAVYLAALTAGVT